MALNLEDILAEYADPERKRKAENATRDRSLLAGLSDAYAQSQQPYGAKYNALSGQNGLIAAQAPIKSFEREQDVLSNLAGNARMQDQAEAQAAALFLGSGRPSVCAVPRRRKTTLRTCSRSLLVAVLAEDKLHQQKA